MQVIDCKTREHDVIYTNRAHLCIIGSPSLEFVFFDEGAGGCDTRCYVTISTNLRGAWWLSGRVFDSGSWGCKFEPHWKHCIVSLSKRLYPLLSTGSTQEDPS